MDATLGIVLMFWSVVAVGPNSANAPPERGNSWSTELNSIGLRLALDEATRDSVPKQQAEKPPPVEAEGTVKHRDGKPGAKAQIIVTGPDGFKAETWADENGRFRFTAPEGRYSIVVQAADKRGDFEATVAKGGLTPREFTLR